MKHLVVRSILVLSFILQSCTVNEHDEFELTWLGWLIIIGGGLLFIFSIIDTHTKAREKGISTSEYLEQEKARLKELEARRQIDIKYLGGYPLWPSPCKAKFQLHDDYISITSGSGEIKLTKNEIKAVDFEKSGKRSAGKTAAGAIVGGVLTGGVGLLVGGAIGAKRTDTSELYITYLYNELELVLNIQTGKKTDDVYSAILTLFK
jgi:hypothetical protein